MRWPARLSLRATLEEGTTTRLRAEHDGPLRLLKTLRPEGPRVAHAVLVHPPGGLVGGDRLDIDVAVGQGAHVLVTTPAATRFYRSVAGAATQAVRAEVACGARLEWLPQETLAYSGCDAHNEVAVRLAPGGQFIGSEVLALGLPRSGLPFEGGQVLQHFEIDGLWLDRGRMRADDRALLAGPCGLAGRTVVASLVLAQTEPLEPTVADAMLARAREAIQDAERQTAGVVGGATWLHRRLLLLRVLADEVEAAQAIVRRVRLAWRQAVWGCEPEAPRVWST